LEALRSELDETNSRQEAYTILKNSFTEIEKRCVKHQKSEIEVKRQLGAYQDFVVSHPNPRGIKSDPFFL
jgi:hypothetical protein